MIKSKDKNILLLPVTDGGVTQPFNMPNVSGYNPSKPNHNGVDFGYHTDTYCDILACQDGKVVDVYSNNSSFGNGIVLQHDYCDENGKSIGHRWTGYVHLRDKPKHKIGDSVKQGEAIGIRGGSPYVNGKAKYGVHLHLYVTSITTAKYTWNTMKANVINGFPLLYKSKKIKYHVLATADKYMMNNLKYMEDIIKVTDPVERNELVNQLTEHSSNLRVRVEPNLNGTIIGFLVKDAYYNWYDVKAADGYNWYKIAESQWVAQTGTMEVLPKITLEEKLQKEINVLTDECEKLQLHLEELTSKLASAEEREANLLGKLASIKEIIAD